MSALATAILVLDDRCTSAPPAHDNMKRHCLCLMSAVGNAELDEVAPTFRELLEGSGVSFVQGCVSGVDLRGKEVTVEGALSDDLDGFMISDDADQGERRRSKYEGRRGMWRRWGVARALFRFSQS